MEKMQWEVHDDGRLINETSEEDFYLKFHFDVLFPLFPNKTKQGGLGMCQFRRKTFFQLGKQWKKATIEAQADHNGDKACLKSYVSLYTYTISENIKNTVHLSAQVLS